MSAMGKADLPASKPEVGSTEYDPAAYELLKTVDDPSALRALDRRGLQRLADELRTFILESVSQTGGAPSPQPWAGGAALPPPPCLTTAPQPHALGRGAPHPPAHN